MKTNDPCSPSASEAALSGTAWLSATRSLQHQPSSSSTSTSSSVSSSTSSTSSSVSSSTSSSASSSSSAPSSSASSLSSAACGPHSNSLSVNPFLLLRDAVKFNKRCEILPGCQFPSLQCSQAIAFTDHNLVLAANTSAGYVSARKGVYTLADLYYFFRTDKSNYTYLDISQKGCLYVSVLERHNLQQTIDANDTDEAVTEPAAKAGSVCAVCLHSDRPVDIPGSSKESRRSNSDDDDDQTTAFSSAPSRCLIGLLAAGLPLGEDFVDNKVRSGSGPTTVGGEGNAIGSESLKISNVLARERPLVGRESFVCLSGCDFTKVTGLFNGMVERQALWRDKDVATKQTDHVRPHNNTGTAGGGAAEERRRRGNLTAKPSNLPPAGTVGSAPRSDTLSALEEIRRLRRPPIIIVPTSSNVLINKNNVKLFLSDGKFVEAAEAIKSLPREQKRRGNEMYMYEEIQHAVCPEGKPVTFHLVESPFTDRFTKKDWRCVVAAIVQPGKWQFNHWPFKTRLDIFVTVKGYFFAYENDNIPDDILQSKVKVFRINRFHRHMDASVMQEFWRSLEDFLLRPRQDNIVYNNIVVK